MSFPRLRGCGAAVLLLVLAACGGGSDQPTAVTPQPSVRSVSVAPSTATLRVGETQALSARVDALNGAGTAVTWSSDHPSLATVSGAGLVMAVAPGTAVVRATSVADPRVSGTTTITVEPGRSITVTPPSATIGIGETARFTATFPSGGGLPAAVSWRSAAPSIATVSESGTVTGVALGTVQIEALATADTTLRGVATVTVGPVVRGVSVLPLAASVFIASTQQLSAHVNADSGVAQSVIWRSSNPAVATVSPTGLVTAVALGSTTITVLSTVDTTRFATASITVPIRPISVAIAERHVNVNPATSLTLTAEVLADPGVSTALVWSSSAPGVASVSATGVVSGVASGTTLITAAAAADVSKWDTVTVRVIPRLANSWSAARLGGALYDDVVAVMPFDAKDAFAINGSGDILRWNGDEWQVSARSATFGATFHALHASASDNLFAVGANGVIVHWDGTAWSATASGTSRALYGIFVENGTTAYAVGSGGTILRWDGVQWTAESSGSTLTLNGVWAAGDIAIAVGAEGEALRRSGSAWARITVPTVETLYGVHGISSADVVVVGAEGAVLRWDGSDWITLPTDGLSGGFFAVSGSTAHEGRRYVVGDEGVLQLDGKGVKAVATPYAPRLYAVAVDGEGVAWVTGQRGAVMRSGSPWTTLNLAPDLLDVWTTSGSNAWAVGEFGSIYRWDGARWTRQVTPTTTTLDAVWGPNASVAFAGGENGTMLRWNGNGWLPMEFPSRATVYGLWGTSGSNVYATTSSGEVLHYNGSAWTRSTQMTSGLWAVFGFSANDVFVTGENGTVSRYDGRSWTMLPVPTRGTLAGAWTTGPTALYTVGANEQGSAGVASRWDGASWSALAVNSPNILTSIWGPTALDFFITGDRGTMLHFDGARWQSVSTGTSDLLWSVSGAPDASGGAFAVGYNSTIVAGSTSAPTSLLSTQRGPVLNKRASLEPARGATLRRGPLPVGPRRILRPR